jgi:hypothetical protein
MLRVDMVNFMERAASKKSLHSFRSIVETRPAYHEPSTRKKHGKNTPVLHLTVVLLLPPFGVRVSKPSLRSCM